MSCDKGYKNQCCCECKLQLEIRICSCGKCPTIKGYLCLLPNDIENLRYCYYKENRHGCCECFIKKEPIRQLSAAFGAPQKKLNVKGCHDCPIASWSGKNDGRCRKIDYVDDRFNITEYGRTKSFHPDCPIDDDGKIRIKPRK